MKNGSYLLMFTGRVYNIFFFNEKESMESICKEWFLKSFKDCYLNMEMCFKLEAIPAFSRLSLKLKDQFTYRGDNIPSTERDATKRRVKERTAIDR